MTKFGQGVRSLSRVSEVWAGCPKLEHTTLLNGLTMYILFDNGGDISISNPGIYIVV